ncbi:MFS transporter [Membranihabitans maritimus]|uniref:MFS transporter n=1 Tax=Membranihabitans maritimus TaxID=2904244 RepID=UPI001EFF8A20|nr:MFS transporter [Membranihabitans maritimus]
MQNAERKSLFLLSCLALLVTSLSFGIRAGILTPLGMEFGLSNEQLAMIAGTAFWGFPLAIIIGGFLVDIVGIKRLMVIAGFLHILGILLTVLSQGFWTLFLSTLLIGVANGTVEAACNPLVATIFPENKTTKLNHFHLWFPGGIVIGSLISFFFTRLGWGWQIQVGTMLLPAIIYLFMTFGKSFPVTERVASGITYNEMLRSLLKPLFIFMVFCMLGTAITELFTNQWIEVLLNKVTDSGLILLAITAGVQTVGRAFAGPMVEKFSPTGTLLVSAILSAAGLFILSQVSGGLLFLGAFIFGMGITYFWPTMLGFVSENIPESGALGMNLIGGMGMFAVTIYMVFMGGYYDQLILNQLPEGADLVTYQISKSGSPEAEAFIEAQTAAGPEILRVTLIIPLILIVAFAGLFIYMRKKSTNSPTFKGNLA